ncbi:MAG: hypothetical protein AAF752_14560 [Bacteroidota bacterium]
MTACYADVFDFAMTPGELCRRLIGEKATQEQVDQALAGLEGAALSIRGGWVTLAGREHLAELRQCRQAFGEAVWTDARRYTRWLNRIPFVRSVSVSGSLAADNADAEGDVDVFCITAPGRLWVARMFIVPLSKLTRVLPVRYLCPNYLVSEGALMVRDQNLFAAHEVVQAKPVFGAAVHRRFLEANRWASHTLPNGFSAAQQGTTEPDTSGQRMIDGMLDALGADAIDRFIHRTFLAFYRRRAERRGWNWPRIASAYTREQYTVPEGGYTDIVRQRFLGRVEQRLGPAFVPDAEALFARAAEPAGAYDWSGDFKQHYGAA